MEGNTQKRAQREPVLAIPGDGPVGGETLQVADEQHPEVDTRRDGGPSLAGKAWSAEVFRPGVKSILGEKVVESGVEGMPLALGKLMLVDPHRLLLGFASTNRHAVNSLFWKGKFRLPHLGIGATGFTGFLRFSTGC